MPSSSFQRSFAAGELAPAMAARADLIKYVTGARTVRNYLVLRAGGVANRPGTRFVNETKASSTATFLLRYVSEIAGESLLLEAGPYFLRFYKNGALVRLTGVVAWNAGTNYVIGDIASSGGVNYYAVKAGLNHAPPNATYWYAMPTDVLEVPTPFGNAGFQWYQSGIVITMTSHLVPPHELICFGLTTWVIQPIDTHPQINPPTALNVVAGTAGTLQYTYCVAAVAADSYEESIAGPIFLVACAAPTPEHPNVLTWVAPVPLPGGPAAVEYNIFLDPYQNGTFGFIGTSTGVVNFNDPGYTPDFAVTPALPVVLFATANNYPAAATTYQQRRFFANTLANPDAVWGSRTGFRSNFNISSPLQDDDAISFRIAGGQHNPVRHLLGLKTLIVLTDAGEWSVGESKVPLAPNNLPADQETYVGVSDVPPVVVGNSILYVQARKSILRDLQFQQAVEGLAGRDVTLFASHLVDGYTLDRIDYAQTPDSIVWACRSDGVLLGLTYLRDQEIAGWHRHDSAADAMFEDVCVVPEPGEDAVYLLVRRTIGGVFKRYIERLESRQILNWNADSFFVDAGLTYTGVPATTISGLAHLNGQVVAVVADGRVIFNGDPTAPNAASYTVAGGAVPAALTTPASIIHAGLAIRFSDLETLNLDSTNLKGEIRDKRKNVHGVTLILDKSVRTFQAGPDVSRLRQVKLNPYEAGLAQVSFTGNEWVQVSTDWNDYGRVFIRHSDPLPLTILGVLPSAEVGG